MSDAEKTPAHERFRRSYFARPRKEPREQKERGPCQHPVYMCGGASEIVKCENCGQYKKRSGWRRVP